MTSQSDDVRIRIIEEPSNKDAATENTSSMRASVPPSSYLKPIAVKPKHPEPGLGKIDESLETVFGASPKALSPSFFAEFQPGLMKSFEQFDIKRSQSKRATNNEPAKSPMSAAGTAPSPSLAPLPPPSTIAPQRSPSSVRALQHLASIDRLRDGSKSHQESQASLVGGGINGGVSSAALPSYSESKEGEQRGKKREKSKKKVDPPPAPAAQAPTDDDDKIDFFDVGAREDQGWPWDTILTVAMTVLTLVSFGVFLYFVLVKYRKANTAVSVNDPQLSWKVPLMWFVAFIPFDLWRLFLWLRSKYAYKFGLGHYRFMAVEYYLEDIRPSLLSSLHIAIIMGCFAGIFYKVKKYHDIETAYDWVLRALGCCLTITGSRMIRGLLVRRFALGYKRQTYLDNMRDMLQMQYVMTRMYERAIGECLKTREKLRALQSDREARRQQERERKERERLERMRAFRLAQATQSTQSFRIGPPGPSLNGGGKKERPSMFRKSAVLQLLTPEKSHTSVTSVFGTAEKPRFRHKTTKSMGGNLDLDLSLAIPEPPTEPPQISDNPIYSPPGPNAPAAADEPIEGAKAGGAKHRRGSTFGNLFGSSSSYGQDLDKLHLGKSKSGNNVNEGGGGGGGGYGSDPASPRAEADWLHSRRPFTFEKPEPSIEELTGCPQPDAELRELRRELQHECRRLLEALHVERFQSDAVRIVSLERAVRERQHLKWNGMTMANSSDGRKEKLTAEFSKFLMMHLATLLPQVEAQTNMAFMRVKSAAEDSDSDDDDDINGNAGRNGPLDMDELAPAEPSATGGNANAAGATTGKDAVPPSTALGAKPAKDGSGALSGSGRLSDLPPELQAPPVVKFLGKTGFMALLAECLLEALGPLLQQYVLPNAPAAAVGKEAGPVVRFENDREGKEVEDEMVYMAANAPRGVEAEEQVAIVGGVRLSAQGERRLFKLVDKMYVYFDANKDSQISETELKLSQIQLIRSYSLMKRRIKENGSLMATLHRVLGTLGWMVNFFIILWICKVDVYRAWISLTSIVLSLSFAFSNSIRQLYDATIFVFYLHPFDTEDSVDIDGNYYKVQRIQLLSTELMTTSGERIIYPNSLLASKVIMNHSRSDPWWDGLELHINLDVPRSVFTELEAKMKEMCASKPQLFSGLVRVRLRMAPLDLQKVKLCVYYGLAFPKTDNGQCSNARDEVFFTVISFLTSKGVRLAHRQEVFIQSMPQPPPPAPGPFENFGGTGPLGDLNSALLRSMEPGAVLQPKSLGPAAASASSGAAASISGATPAIGVPTIGTTTTPYAGGLANHSAASASAAPGSLTLDSLRLPTAGPLSVHATAASTGVDGREGQDLRRRVPVPVDPQGVQTQAPVAPGTGSGGATQTSAPLGLRSPGANSGGPARGAGHRL